MYWTSRARRLMPRSLVGLRHLQIALMREYFATVHVPYQYRPDDGKVQIDWYGPAGTA